MNTFLFAGTISGGAGLLTFLTIHHFWIKPIWFILPPGLVIAGLGGLAVGWAYEQLLPYLPPRPWTAVALVALIGVILLPSMVLAELHGPLYDFSIAPGGTFLVSTRQAVRFFVLDLVLTATLAGALAGWFLAHSSRAAFATALAGLIFALGPGHNIPFLGGTPGAWKGIALLAAIVIVSAIVLVETQNFMSIRRLP